MVLLAAITKVGAGASRRARTRLAPYSRVADVQAAMTFLGIQPEVDGVSGFVERVTVVRPWFGSRLMTNASNAPRWCRRHGSWRTRWMQVCVARTNGSIYWRCRRIVKQRVVSGKSGMAGQDEILLPDRQSAALASAARAKNPNALSGASIEYISTRRSSFTRSGSSTRFRRARCY